MCFQMEYGLSCQLCSAASHLNFNIKSYIQHLRLFHACQIDFKIRCGIGGCQRSYTNCGTYINHIYSIHGDSFTCKASHNQPEDDSFDEDDSSDQDDQYGSVDMQEGCDIPHNDSMGLGYSEETAQNFTARFLLGLKEKFKLTQVSLQGVIKGVTALNQQRIHSLKQEVCILYYFILFLSSIFWYVRCTRFYTIQTFLYHKFLFLKSALNSIKTHFQDLKPSICSINTTKRTLT